MSATNFPSDRSGRPDDAAPDGVPPEPAAPDIAQPAAAGVSETRSSAIMAAGTLVSRFLGFGKTWMLGTALGLGSTVNDTFINANNLPNLIFLLVAGFSTIGVLSQTAILLVPVFRLKLGLRPRFGWRGVGLGHAA
ncbi:MAG TPA: hypothetical protein VGE95_18455, partial [Arthrobacter sp.]